MRSRMNFYLLGFLLFCVLPLGLGASLSPETGRMQGRLFDEAGLPMEGPVGLTLSVYEAETGGSALYQESHASVPLAEGSFSVTLGQGVPVTGTHDETLYTGGGQRWIEIAVEGDILTPRQRVHAVPYALAAEVAESARQVINGIQLTDATLKHYVFIADYDYEDEASTILSRDNKLIVWNHPLVVGGFENGSESFSVHNQSLGAGDLFVTGDLYFNNGALISSW